jgi:hypothetical protein
VKRVPEATARHLMRQLAAGLRQMWAHHLVHVSSPPLRNRSPSRQAPALLGRGNGRAAAPRAERLTSACPAPSRRRPFHPSCPLLPPAA